MPNGFNFDRSPDSTGREAYSVSYDQLSKKATIDVRGTKFVLDGLYDDYAAAMCAVRDFLSRQGLKL